MVVRYLLAVLVAIGATGCTASTKPSTASSASAGVAAPDKGVCPKEVPASSPDPWYLALNMLRTIMGPCYYAADADDEGALYHSVDSNQPDIRIEIRAGQEGYERWESFRNVSGYDNLDERFGGVLMRLATGPYGSVYACICNKQNKTGAFLRVVLDGVSSGNNSNKGVKLTAEQKELYVTGKDGAEPLLFQLLEKLIEQPLRSLARQ
jgi:hypothetical protein